VAFLMAVASSVLYGIADFLGGIGSRRGPVLVITAWFQVAGVLPLVLYSLLTPGTAARADLAWGAAAGAAGGLGVLLLYHALATGVVSTAAPLISMIALTVPVVIGLGLGERPGVLPLAGIVLGCVAVVLISVQSGGQPGAGEGGLAGERDVRIVPEAERARAPRSGAAAFATAAASGVLIGLFLVFVARVQPGSGGWPLVMGRSVATMLTFGLLFLRRVPVRPPASTHAFIAGGAVCDVSANVLYLLAVQRAPMSLIATLVSLAPATTVVLAQLVLRERLAATQRWGVALALVTVVMLSQG
jgi:drug/metabolite transporter (DMT)-like permease